MLQTHIVKCTSKFWTSLFQAIGTQLYFSTAYHPQTDEQTERANQVIEDIVRSYCSQEPRKWVQYLPLVEYAYNSFDHRSIGMSPFKALYGQESIAPLNFSDPTIKVEASKQMLDEMEAQTKAIRKDIQAAQDRQKHYADKDRSERTFKLRDRVFLSEVRKLLQADFIYLVEDSEWVSFVVVTSKKNGKWQVMNVILFVMATLDTFRLELQKKTRRR
ncbi:hypothetical protein L7F22_041788 [Adiantum nelumboides]|nr:hypothetical protein [Adiantum nelumboides]